MKKAIRRMKELRKIIYDLKEGRIARKFEGFFETRELTQ